MKTTMRIPTAPYAYLELEGSHEDIPEMIKLYDRHAEKPGLLPNRETTKANGLGNAKVVTTFTGEDIMYDPVAHKYTTLDGEPLLSGSAYAERFATPFDREKLLEATAKKLGAPVSEVGAAWDLRGEISRTFGTALHKAMEAYFKYNRLGYGVPKHPFLKMAVETFPIKGKKVLSEIMVSDISRKLVGQIDGLVCEDTRKGVVIDFKSDAEVKKNLTKHFNQLSFYANILIAHGWEISAVVVWNYSDGWTPFESEVLPLKLD